MSKLILILFAVVFFSILIGANIYLSRRFAWYFSFESAGWFYISFAALTVFMIGGLLSSSNSVSSIGNLAYSAAAIIMGFVLYLLLSTLFVDLIHLVVKLQPVYYGLLAIALSLIISGYGMWNASMLKVTQIEVPVKGLHNEVRAMHLSDIHIGHCRGKSFLQKIVDKTNLQHPDVVFITGDLFDGKIGLNEENIALLKELRVPVFFVEGNHDNYTGIKTIKDLLRKIDVRVLEDEVINWGEFQIIGLNHMQADNNAFNMHAGAEGATIKSVLGRMMVEKGKPAILLHHSPDGIQYANEKGVDLYLAGHTHAGQLFPVNYINELLFSYNKGLHDYKGTRIFVSEGAGTFGPPMRLGTKNEITLIKLIPEK